MSWEDIIKRSSEEEVRSDAQRNADELNKPNYLFQDYENGHWLFYDEPPKNDIKYETINPTVRMEEGAKFSEEFRVKEGMDTSK
tara:strand:+ start:2475 stop:2726 length:252 start_codon:yes stop_codon:yes gene_type:complete